MDDLAGLQAPPRVGWPRAVQILWFGQRQWNFMFHYRDKFGYKPADFPNASSAFERIVSLPIYPRMTEADVESVIGAVSKVVKQYRS